MLALASIVYTLAFSSTNSKSTNTTSGSTGSSSSSSSKHSPLVGQLVEAAVHALLGLSQIENMRPFFAIPLPLPVSHTIKQTVAEDTDQVSAIHAIMRILKDYPEHKPNCLGLMMNACLDRPKDLSAASAGANTGILSAFGVE